VARLRCDVVSEVLGLDTSMTVILPDDPAGPPPPVLYLLHGLTDDDTAWVRYTSVERYSAPLGLAVVMPQVHRSFYADEAGGGRYWTFLSEELPALVEGYFRVSTRREDTFVAGLSMGGYGALRWALRAPERFAAAASMSGVLDVGVLEHREWPEDPHMVERIFGGRGPAESDDLLRLVARADPARLPALHVSCGTGDALLTGNHRFLDAAGAAGVAVTSAFGPGEHDWAYWDARIQDVLAWLPLDRT